MRACRVVMSVLLLRCVFVGVNRIAVGVSRACSSVCVSSVCSSVHVVSVGCVFVGVRFVFVGVCIRRCVFVFVGSP